LANVPAFFISTNNKTQKPAQLLRLKFMPKLNTQTRYKN